MSYCSVTSSSVYAVVAVASSDQYPNTFPSFSTPSVSFSALTFATASESFAPIRTCFLTAFTAFSPFFPPLKSNVTNLYPSSGVSGCSWFGSITLSPYLAVNVVVVTFPSFLARTFLPSSPSLSIQATKFFVAWVGLPGSATAGVAVLAASQVVPFNTSNTFFSPACLPVIVPSAVGSKVTLAYPSGTPGNVPSAPGVGTITIGCEVNVIVPPFLMSYSFSTLYSTASFPITNVNLLSAVSSVTVSVGLVPG